MSRGKHSPSDCVLHTKVIRLSEAWTSELQRTAGVDFSFPKLILMLILPNHTLSYFSPCDGYQTNSPYTFTVLSSSKSRTTSAQLERVFCRHHPSDCHGNGSSRGHRIKTINLFHIRQWKMTKRDQSWIWTDHLGMKNSISHCIELSGTLPHSLPLAGDLKHSNTLPEDTAWLSSWRKMKKIKTFRSFAGLLFWNKGSMSSDWDMLTSL